MRFTNCFRRLVCVSLRHPPAPLAQTHGTVGASGGKSGERYAAPTVRTVVYPPPRKPSRKPHVYVPSVGITRYNLFLVYRDHLHRDARSPAVRFAYIQPKHTPEVPFFDRQVRLDQGPSLTFRESLAWEIFLDVIFFLVRKSWRFLSGKIFRLVIITIDVAAKDCNWS